MSVVNEAGFAALLPGLSGGVTSIWILRRNAAFPTPSVSDPAGQASQWQSTAATAFAALWTAARSRGWKISTAALPTFNFTYASANNPGSSYQPALTDVLFDDFP